MSAVVEAPADEDPNVNPIENDEEDEAKNISDTETEPAMLDEEEMPSYVSLTSLPVHDETRGEQNIPEQSEPPADNEERASSPYQSEQGAESVCVVSSGEESNQRPYGMMEDYDSEDMDMEDEEEEEEEEDDDSCMNEEEESDGDIEPEQFERSSDDFVLRYDSGLERHHKERSRSLQDLTNSHGNLARFVGKRRSIDLMGSYESEFSHQVGQPLDDPLALRKKMPRSVNYDHIPSKVKLYIQEMKEQRKRSAERMNRENPLQTNFSDANSRGDNADVPRAATTQNPESKRIKSYVENVINEIKTKERNVVDESHYAEHHTIQERGEEFSDINMIEEMETEKEVYEMESNKNPENLALTSENLSKKLKANGLVECNEKIVEPSKTKETNGEEQIATILNFRTLSYEEYTNGDENSGAIVENLSRSRVQGKNAAECTGKNVGSVVGEPKIHKSSSPSRREDEKLSQVGSNEPRNDWNLRKVTLDESSRRKVAQVDSEVYQKMLDENVNLKLELEEMRKTLEQCRSENQPKEVYQRTLTENASLKLELQEMRNKLEHYRAESVRAETKIASVQTEIVVEEKMDVTEPRAKPSASMNKLFSSTATSTQSSIEQWSDSNCSAAISIDPPNIEAALNADDSLALGERTSSKPSHVLSHSFVTSSRILQTLANITQGRTRTSTGGQAAPNPTKKNAQAEPQGQSERQTFDPIPNTNEEARASRAKKRKASDMLDAHLETFKIPHTTGDTRKKINSDSATDTTYNATEQRARNDYQKLTKNPDENNPRRTEDDEDDNDPPDTPHNVKYFVYHDEPDAKERSFLIQAEDTPRNTETIDKGGNVRECGPFLLGNVEIRMSETNGTINIWGKELSKPTEESEVETGIEDPETHDSPAFPPRQSFVCQSTPFTKCANLNTSSCSSTKKAKISPKFSRSGIGKYFRSAATNFTKTMNNPVNSGHFGHSVNSSLADDSRTSHCEHCESHQQRVKTASCEYLANSRIKHSCCLHNPETNEKECECVSDNEVFDDSTMYETISNILANHEKYANSFNNLMSKHLCTNVASEEKCRHHTSPGSRSFGREQDLHRSYKRFSSCTDDLPSCSRRLAPTTRQCRDHSCRSHSHISCEEDDHPLLFNESPSETPETKRRRLSGKRVRGILTDLLRGCSGCRDPNSTSSLPRANSQNAAPKIHVTPCTPPIPSCSKRNNSSSSHPNNHPSSESVRARCCSSCSRPAEVRAQIESELEILRSTMEQLLARSNAFLEGLNLL